MKKKIIAAIIIVSGVMLASFFKKGAGKNIVSGSALNCSKEPVIEFDREIIFSSEKRRYMESAIITARAEDKEILWKYESQEYPVSGLLPVISDILKKDGRYYIYQKTYKNTPASK